jgi:hypothetical protein
VDGKAFSDSRLLMRVLNIFIRHFSGEEGFDTGPMAPASEPPSVQADRSGAKL